MATDGFTAAVDDASVAWALISAGWFIDLALAGNPLPNDPSIVAPPRRAFLLHRLALPHAETCPTWQQHCEPGRPVSSSGGGHSHCPSASVSQIAIPGWAAGGGGK
ncbi:MAG: hypothetical protein ACYCUG_17670 [Acidimicrobiales bacterium]